MILHRLFELAERERLLEDPAFEAQPVAFVIHLDREGQFLGLTDHREEIVTPNKDPNKQPKKSRSKGRELAVPKAHGNTANKGFARYFCDTLARVLPVPDEDEQSAQKSANSRRTFWEQIRRAAADSGDPALEAVARFGRDLQSGPASDDASPAETVPAETVPAETVLANTAAADRVLAELGAMKPGPGDRCTFAWDPDRGKTLLERDSVRAWYRAFYTNAMGEKAAEGLQGLCQVTGEIGPIPTSHATKLAGVPGGISSGVALVSYDKAAFESYGLDKAANAAIGARAADGYTRALVALLGNKFPGRQTCFRVGGVAFLFWTRDPASEVDCVLLDQPDPDQVAKLLKSPLSGTEDHGAEPSDFYCLALSANSARAIVRDYLELPVRAARENLAQWFRDLRIADLSREHQGQPQACFPLWQLALATALDSDHVAPDTARRLFDAALTGDAPSDSILSACLQRLSVEGGQGFRAPRMGLVKLILRRKGIPVTETLEDAERHPAYVYGRLLALFEQIQYAALGEVNATVVDKYYGTFSAAPAMLFSRLFDSAQNHLRKLRGEKPGAYTALDRQLQELTGLLPALPPRGQLSLSDRGRFALGYYHQRARQFSDIAERKAAKAAAEASV